jgi:adenosylcobinamide-phosphate synthase
VKRNRTDFAVGPEPGVHPGHAALSAAALLGGYGADLLVGDPRRWHPVAGFGRGARALERAAYCPTRLRGALVTAVLVALPALASELLARALARVGVRRELVLAALTWVALGGRSLRAEAVNVSDLVQHGELERARYALRALCGRDAGTLDAGGLCRAAVESLAENTGDAVVGALLWAAIAGPAGVSAYRAANTLDAMIGHRNERYADFGWAAAKLDDLLSWPAARLAAALACLSAPLVGGSMRETAHVVQRDGRAHPSPNAGQIEAAFAGALGLALGGPLAYDGRVELRGRLGHGRDPEVRDVGRAVRLSMVVGAAAALCAAVTAALKRVLHPGYRRPASPGRKRWP